MDMDKRRCDHEEYKREEKQIDIIIDMILCFSWEKSIRSTDVQIPEITPQDNIYVKSFNQVCEDNNCTPEDIITPLLLRLLDEIQYSSQYERISSFKKIVYLLFLLQESTVNNRFSLETLGKLERASDYDIFHCYSEEMRKKIITIFRQSPRLQQLLLRPIKIGDDIIQNTMTWKILHTREGFKWGNFIVSKDS